MKRPAATPQAPSPPPSGARSAQYAAMAEGWASYQLQRELASGGMGRIFEGHDYQLDRQVAVKVSTMRAGRIDPRFLREAQVLAKLSHPNIVPVYHIGQDESGNSCYIMKLVRGRTLQAILDSLREDEPSAPSEYTLDKLLGIFLKICDAMAFAHAQGVLHRDLKPENVMVGEFGEVLVMDWGVSKIRHGTSPAGKEAPRLELSAEISEETLNGEIVGTPGYLSPEQAQGRIQDLDERTDIFGLGGILHAILTLHPPVEGSTLLEVLIHSKRGQLSRRLYRTDKNKVPHALQKVTLKALAFNAENRYTSVVEMARDIENFRAGFATLAEDARLLRRFLLFVNRHRALTTILCLFVTTLLVFTLRLRESEHEATENARVAIAERETAKREAARVLLAPIEIAMRDFDGEEMQRMLAEVPEHLRGQQWRYLHSRLDTARLTAEAPDGVHFVGAVSHPVKENLFFTLQANGFVRSFDAQTGDFTDLFNLEGPSISTALVGLSKDATRIAILSDIPSGSRIQVRNLPGGEQVLDAVSKNPFSRVFFNPEGNILFCSSRIKGKGWVLAEAWNLETGARETVFDGYLFGDESGGTPRLYSVSKTKVITEIDLSNGRPTPEQAQIELNECVRHINFSHGHIISPDSKVLFTVGGGQSLLRRINIATGAVNYEALVAPGQLSGMSRVDSTGMLATLMQRSKRCSVLQLWQPDTGALCKTVISTGGDGTPLLCVQMLSGQAAVFEGARVKVWNFHEPEPHDRIEGISPNRPWFTFLANSPFAVMTLSTGGLQLMDLRKETQTRSSLVLESGRVGIPSVSSDGATLLFSQRSGSPDEKLDSVRIFRQAGGALVQEGNFSHARIAEEGSRRLLSPDGRLFASTHAGAPGVYMTQTGTLVTRLQTPNLRNNIGGPNSFWLDPSHIVSVVNAKDDRPWSDPTSTAEAIQVWDALSGEAVVRIYAPKVGLLSGSPDGQTIAEAGTDLRLRFRTASSLQVEREFRGHDTPIKCMAWHPWLPVLVTGGDDSAVRVWDTRNGSLIKEFDGIQFPRQLHVSPDGRTLCVIQKSSATAKIYALDVSLP